MSTHTTPATAGTTPGTPPKKNYTLLAFGVIIVFLVIVLPRFVNFKDSSDETDKEKKSKTTNQITVRSNYNYEKTVKFTGEFKDTTNIPSGFYVSIKEASEPYCLENGNKSESGCSIGKEDISSNDNFTADNPNNRTLRFKSQNGKDGYVILLLRSKQ